MKFIVDYVDRTLKVLENTKSIYVGNNNADVLELYSTRPFTTGYLTITALLSNGRKIGPFSTDSGYTTEVLEDGITYYVSKFTLTRSNGFTLSEGKLSLTIWYYETNTSGNDTVKKAIGNILLNVINTSMVEDDIIMIDESGEAIYNFTTEIENIRSAVNDINSNYVNLESFNDTVDILEEKIPYGDRKYHYSLNLTVANTVKELVDELKTYQKFDENNEGKFYIKLSDDNILENIHIKWTYSDKTNITRYYITSIIRKSNNIKIYADIINIGLESLTISELIAQHKQVAVVDEIPTKVSQLENDAEYVPLETLNDTKDELREYVDDSIPTKVSQLENDSEFITKTVENLDNYYRKNEVIQLISNYKGVNLQKVESLPTENVQTNVIYLVPANDSEDNNYYEEYIYINDNWELIGTTKVDLSGYALTTDIPTRTSELENDSDYTTYSYVNTKLSGKANASAVYSIDQIDALLTDKANSNEVYTTDQVDVLLNQKPNFSSIPTATSQLVNDSDFVSKTDLPIIDLGTITDDFKESSCEKLNNVKTAGLYKFTYGTKAYLMQVHEYGSIIHQCIYDGIELTVRTYSMVVWSISFKNLATMGDIPTTTSELTNDNNFATTTYVDEAVANAGGGKVYNHKVGIVYDGENGDREYTIFFEFYSTSSTQIDLWEKIKNSFNLCYIRDEDEGPDYFIGIIEGIGGTAYFFGGSINDSNANQYIYFTIDSSNQYQIYSYTIAEV